MMLHFVSLWAKERGNKKFHLGGGVGASEDNLFFFKSGFSKLRADYYTWRIIFDREMYDAAEAQWKDLAKVPPDDISQFFPSYRKPI